MPSRFAAADVEQWLALGVVHYVVVDDLDEDVVVLSVSTWPQVDRTGRVHFLAAEGERSGEMRASFEFLVEFLTKYRSVSLERPLPWAMDSAQEEIHGRPVRVGDTFGMSDDALQAACGRSPEVETGGIVVLDVTADARELAKIAFYAAAAGTLNPAEDDDYKLASTAWKLQREEVSGDQPEARS
jgi:hypothetical protein